MRRNDHVLSMQGFRSAALGPWGVVHIVALLSVQVAPRDQGCDGSHGKNDAPRKAPTPVLHEPTLVRTCVGQSVGSIPEKSVQPCSNPGQLAALTVRRNAGHSHRRYKHPYHKRKRYKSPGILRFMSLGRHRDGASQVHMCCSASTNDAGSSSRSGQHSAIDQATEGLPQPSRLFSCATAEGANLNVVAAMLHLIADVLRGLAILAVSALIEASYVGWPLPRVRAKPIIHHTHSIDRGMLALLVATSRHRQYSKPTHFTLLPLHPLNSPLCLDSMSGERALADTLGFPCPQAQAQDILVICADVMSAVSLRCCRDHHSARVAKSGVHQHS